MKKKFKNITFLLILLATVGEFLCCFLRGYQELWLTILIVSLEIILLETVGRFTKLGFFSLIAITLGLTGSILLIGFPSYIPFCALICFGLSLISEFIAFFILK